MRTRGTWTKNDPRQLAASVKGRAKAIAAPNAGRFTTNEPRASRAGRLGRWASPWNDRKPEEHMRHKRLELIRQIAQRTAR